MKKQSLISDNISNVGMPDLIRHPEYRDLDCGLRRNPPYILGCTPSDERKCKSVLPYIPTFVGMTRYADVATG
jgi:hypothetical protein